MGKWRFSVDRIFLIVYCTEMNYQTEPITFNIQSNGGYNYRFSECVEQMAQLAGRYFDIYVEDTSPISNMLDTIVVNAMREQEKQNELDNINGGSK